MSEDMNLFHAGVSGVTAAAVAFIGFVTKRFVGKVDDTAMALAQHEKEDIGKYATMDSLVRVHQRIDENRKAVDDGFRETRESLQQLTHFLMGGQK